MIISFRTIQDHSVNHRIVNVCQCLLYTRSCHQLPPVATCGNGGYQTKLRQKYLRGSAGNSRSQHQRFNMGIPGLTSYISSHSTVYLEYYELHDTYLVIDGNNIACHLYRRRANNNGCFGGDYDRYAQCATEFFDGLLRCNITPLVVCDGSFENKKLNTVISRTRDRIRAAATCSPVSHDRGNFFPLFMMNVFIEVLNEMRIRYVQCLSEADNAIAAVAKALDCPALSNDSDFYIFGVLYIPFDTMDSRVVRNTNGTGYATRCKIYRVETLLNIFKGLDESLLPLAAIILGNDYVKRDTFRNFFSSMKLSTVGKTRFNEQQRRIHTTFLWLRRHTLNEAIAALLSRLPKERRRQVLDIIETNMETYMCLPTNILSRLGLSDEHAVRVNSENAHKCYKFQGDINNLTYINDSPESVRSESSQDEENDENEIADTHGEADAHGSNGAVGSLPQWFINDFHAGLLPSYFLDLLTRRLYICPVQVEDYIRPSSIQISLKIINVICGLLISVKPPPNGYFNLMMQENHALKRQKLRFHKDVSQGQLPPLALLREIPQIERKRIIHDALGISNDVHVDGFPSKWKLYVASANYWLQQHQEASRLECHVIALLFTMLFNAINEKVGYHRNASSFQRKYACRIQTIRDAKSKMERQPNYSKNVTVTEAYEQVEEDDCVIAAPFFISHCDMDEKLLANPKKFNKALVHYFSQFQACLRHSTDLNALLGCPYEQPRVAKLLNGTLLYNLCANFQKRKDIQAYINCVLQNSPSLLRLYHVMLCQLQTLCTAVFATEKKTYVCKRQKTRSEPREIVEEDAAIPEPNVPFYDANNTFSLLGTM